MKYLNFFAYLVLLVALSAFCYVGFLFFYPYQTIVVKGTTVLTPVLKAGDLFVYQVDYCKYTTAPAVVYRTFHSVDESSIQTFPSVQTVSVLGCNKTKVPLETYFTMPPGDYYMLVDAQFQVNPLRKVDVIFRTTAFTVK